MDGDGGRKLIRGTSRPSNNDDVGVIYKGKTPIKTTPNIIGESTYKATNELI